MPNNDDNWDGSSNNWNQGGDWSDGSVPASYEAAVATAGTITVTDTESTGGIDFSGTAALVINGGSLTVGSSQLGGNIDNFILGSAGAVLTGSNSLLSISSSLTGTASGTVYLEGTGSEFFWGPQLSNFPAPATSVNSSGLTVDFNDGGQGASFVVQAAFDGTVAGFGVGDSISWSDQDSSTNGSFTSVIGNDTVTLTDSNNHSVTFNFAGTSNQYNSSDISVSSSGVISTTFTPPAPAVGSATYDASTGQLVVSAASVADGFTSNPGDFDPTQLTVTGEDGLTYTLTGGAVSNVSSASFTVTLSSADQLQVDGLFDNNGTSSTGNDIFNQGSGPTTYEISAGASFDAGGKASSGGVTVGNALAPTISGVSYDPNSGLLTLTGTELEDIGGYGGVNLGQITLTGGSNQQFTFNADDYGNVVSSTEAIIDLSNTTASNSQSVMSGEEGSVNSVFDKIGFVSNEGTTYNFSATSGWDSGAGDVITTEAVQVTCFVTGTRIRTTEGEVAVEDLKVGDNAITGDGRSKSIRWIGRRHINCSRQPSPSKTWPVRVRAGTFGEGMPYADLWLSPGHALRLDDCLVPVRGLIDGDRVVSVERETVTYWHVEVDGHDVLLANGMPAESYLDAGNRGFFDDSATLSLHFDESPAPSFDGSGYCLPLVESGPRLSAIRARWLAHPARARDPLATDVWMMADEVAVAPCFVSAEELRFLIPSGTADVRMKSATFVAAGGDIRRLGVSVNSLAVSDGSGWRDIDLDDPGLFAGFHDLERSAHGSWRWTDGEAHVSPRIWSDLTGPALIRVTGQFAVQPSNAGVETVEREAA